MSSGGGQHPEKDINDTKIHLAGDKYIPFREKAKRDCDELYPDCDKKTYRVPSRIVNSKPAKTVPGEEYSVSEGRNKENAKGEEAESLVLDKLEDLKCIDGEEQPMFIIHNFNFLNYLNEVNLQLEVNPLKKGQHDILLLHLHHGVVFIRVKSVEEAKPDSTKKQRDNHNKMIRKRVEGGLQQLNKDEEMFRHVMGDLHLNVPIIKVLALPNISREYMLKLTTTTKLLKESLGEKGIDICLFRDHFKPEEEKMADNMNKQKKLLEWWKTNIFPYPGFHNEDEYKQVKGRYVGLMSTVTSRTPGDAVAEEGNQNTRNVLTPGQTNILHSNESKVYIQGAFGTGKTTLQILKARQLVREGQSVLMVCGRSAKLLSYLVACVKADMSEEQKSLMHYITDYRTLDSLDSCEKYNIIVDECSMCAVSSIMDYCRSRDILCWLAGRYVPDIKEFTVVQLNKELRSQENVRCNFRQMDERFLNSILYNETLSVIDHTSHSQSEGEFDGSSIWRCKQCWETITNSFIQLGLLKCNHGQLQSCNSSAYFSDTHEDSADGECKELTPKMTNIDGCVFKPKHTEGKKVEIDSTNNQNNPNMQGNDLTLLMEHQTPLSWSEVAILIPDASIINNKAIEAIVQISSKYGMPFNYSPIIRKDVKKEIMANVHPPTIMMKICSWAKLVMLLFVGVLTVLERRCQTVRLGACCLI